MGSRERCCFCSVRVPLAPILPGLRAWTIGGGPLEEIAACAVSLGLVVVPFVLFTSVQSSLLQFKFAPARSTIWISPFPSSLQLPPLPPLSTLDGSHGCSIISKAGVGGISCAEASLSAIPRLSLASRRGLLSLSTRTSSLPVIISTYADVAR